MHHTLSLKAFSLVELSIVLVILGLLVGGVLSGQSLIHAAELRSLTQEYSKYVAATNSFKDKYFYIPGDMPNAASFWGLLDPDPWTCSDIASTNTKTCNGSGNGKLDWSEPGYEPMRYWQHLANAGLIEGRYDGLDSVPPTKLSGGIWSITYYGTRAPGDLSEFPGFYGNLYQVYAPNATGQNLLTAEDAWNIDKKLDDGIPSSGKLFAEKGNATYPCTSAAGTATNTGTYNLSNKGIICSLDFINLF